MIEGLPNDDYFPYDTLEAKTALPNRWVPTPNKPVDPPSASTKQLSSHLEVPKAANTLDPLRKIDLRSALQYGTAQGYPPLYQFIRQFVTQHLHPNVPYNGGPEVVLTCGSTDGFSKAIQALSNEWSDGYDPVEAREGLLCEEYAYMNAIQTARPRGMNIVPVGIDNEGMRAEGPGGLRDVLENWDHRRGQIPHLMYTVTIGQNPTSGTLGVTRRKEIYSLCKEYDIIIIEDDPYWYLQYPSSATHQLPASYNAPKSSGYAFLDSLVPSYLSVDTDGRVVRLDTFSKTVAPGCRLGWITAQPALIERMLRITETSTQQPSGFVQSLIAELIVGPPSAKSGNGSGGLQNGKGWDADGWVRWLEGLRGEYERRMNEMCDVLEAGRAALQCRDGADGDWADVRQVYPYEFVRPLAGMFVWLRFDFGSHPLARRVPPPRLSRALWVFWTTAPFKVLVSPGGIFAPTAEIAERDAWKCFRVCFAAVPREELRPISSRFVDGVRAFWEIRDVGKIDELLEDEDRVVMGIEDVAGMAAMTGFC